MAEHGERVGDAAGAEDGEDAFAVGEGVGAHRNAADRDADDVAVAEDRGAHRARDLLELLAPALRVGVGDVLLADDLVEEEIEQAVLAADVAVERGGAGIELVGDPAHAEPVEALGIEDAYGRLDDRLARDRVAARPAGRGRAAARAAGAAARRARERVQPLANTVPRANDVCVLGALVEHRSLENYVR